jgi:Zn-dependent M28 family amino/carboxypeptidase
MTRGRYRSPVITGRPDRRIALLVVAVALAAPAASGSPSVPSDAQQRPQTGITLAGIREHLVALQRIAGQNGGNRAAGTKGYDESARYVAARMRAAGYRVRLQELTFPFVFDRSPPELRALDGAAWPYRAGRDYVTLTYSGSGRVEAAVTAVDLLVPSPAPNTSTSGCEASDFASFPRGSVALVQRGTCTFRVKVANAVSAGAAAVVVMNEGNTGRTDVFAGTLGPPQVRVPAIAAGFAVGEALRDGVRNGPTGVRALVAADVAAETRRTRNVIAESRVGNPSRLVVAGAHLDSVPDGPGINDNGSGSAVVLETAEQLAGTRPRNRLRFVWWGAEELGLVGSRHYVETLSPSARRRHALYLNFDMVGSPNFVPYVYDGDASSTGNGVRLAPGSAVIERVFTRYFSSRDLPYRQTGIGGQSDHFPFAQAGIPVGGLFTGADGRKSPEEAAAFGGRAGQPYDPCYHRACDRLTNVSGAALTRMAGAALHAIRRFAADTSTLGRTP